MVKVTPLQAPPAVPVPVVDSMKTPKLGVVQGVKGDGSPHAGVEGDLGNGDRTNA